MGERTARCCRCLLPEGTFHVRLDETGLCNYCRFWDAHHEDVRSPERHNHRLVDRLQRHRGRFHYDAAVGLSGGKDSAYVLRRLISAYRANVLAITFDNGFLTDHAWGNVRDIARASDVDHFVYRPDWEAYREFYRVTLRKLGDPCVACSIGGYVLSVRGCGDLRIPLFVHGRSPMQMFRHWYPGTRDPGIRVVQANLGELSPVLLRRQYRSMIRRLRALLLYLVPNPRLRRRIDRELFGDGLKRDEIVPEFLAFFLFEPYDEAEIVRELESANVGYRRPENRAILGHGDCLIHDVAAHLYARHHGVSRVLPDVASMLRHGMIDEEKAHAILKANEPTEEEVETSIGHLLERLDMTRLEFDRIADRMSQKSSAMPFG